MNTEPMATLQNRLDTLIQSRSLLTHPFYQDWRAGMLSMDDLRLYAIQYYHFEVNFPRFLSAIHSRCDKVDVRQVILDNLWDEEHGSKNHRSLWLDFARGLGMNEDEIETASTTAASTLALAETYNKRCMQGSYLEGLAAIYAYESQVPQIMGEKLHGLREIYGVTDPVTLRFFEIHRDLDHKHASQEVQAIVAYTSAEQESSVEEATQEAADAWWNFLDGVQKLRLSASRL